MKTDLKIVSVVGARPQFIKAAPVSRAFSTTAGCRELIVHTGQHFDQQMSGAFFEELGISPPAHNLGVGGGSHAEMIGGMLIKLEPVLRHEAPDMVLVYGDTNSTLAGGLAAVKLGIPVCHIEAGLRSFNRRMPEETNRIIVDHLSDLLLCPTRTSVANLANEGIDKNVHLVGDVMYDTALELEERVLKESTILKRLGLNEKEYQFATVHRAENTDDRRCLTDIIGYLRGRTEEFPVVIPVHPRTRRAIEYFGIRLDGLIAIEPLGYVDSTRLLHGARMVYTDSGGLQKEAYFHRVPCVTLRSETEWIETIEAGWNRLWNTEDYAPQKDISDYGDGHAAPKVVAAIIGFGFRDNVSSLGAR